jgi:hypothetical protein
MIASRNEVLQGNWKMSLWSYTYFFVMAMGTSDLVPNVVESTIRYYFLKPTFTLLFGLSYLIFSFRSDERVRPVS